MKGHRSLDIVHWTSFTGHRSLAICLLDTGDVGDEVGDDVGLASAEAAKGLKS